MLTFGLNTCGQLMLTIGLAPLCEPVVIEVCEIEIEAYEVELELPGPCED